MPDLNIHYQIKAAAQSVSAVLLAGVEAVVRLRGRLGCGGRTAPDSSGLAPEEAGR